MADSWYVIVIVVVAVLLVLFLRNRQQGSERGRADRTAAVDPARDFRTEREDTRRTGLSAEDQAWESASLQRNQDNRDRAATPADESIIPSPEPRDRGPGV